MLYRAALSSLSVARAISLDRACSPIWRASYRAYFQVYGPRASLPERLATFFLREWPAAVQSLGRPIWSPSP